MRGNQAVTAAVATYSLVLDAGDDLLDELARFAGSARVGTASITATGGLSSATLASFDPDTSQYVHTPVWQQADVQSLAGIVDVWARQPRCHLHAVLRCRDGWTRSGDLQAARVQPRLEVTAIELPPHLVRGHDEGSGLPLLDVDRRQPMPEAEHTGQRRGWVWMSR